MIFGPSWHGSLFRSTGLVAQRRLHQKVSVELLPTKSCGFLYSRALCYAIVLPGRHSGQDVWPDCCRETTESPLRQAKDRPEGRFRCFPGSSPAKIRPGRPISGPEALLRNIECGLERWITGVFCSGDHATGCSAHPIFRASLAGGVGVSQYSMLRNSASGP